MTQTQSPTTRLCLWLLGCLVLLTAAPIQAKLEAYADPRTLEEIDSLRLILRSDSAATGTLDTSPLTQDFEILNQNTASQTRRNGLGDIQSSTEITLLLRPKRSGKLIIPALRLGTEQSPPLPIVVTPLDPNIRQAIADLVFFEVNVMPDPVYVQSETLMIRRLYYSTSGGVQMYSEMPGAPEIADAVVTTLGQTASYETQRNGQRYGVIEQAFAIIPERSGSLVIPSVSITSSIRMQKQGRVRRTGVRVTSDELTLSVLPIPAEYPKDQPWLAATDVTLVETWAPQPLKFVVGETLTRQVIARVTGNVASAIPPLTSSVDNAAFRVYPDAPQLNDDNRELSNRGTRSETFSIVPSIQGSATLPSLSLTWWDVKNQQVKTASINPRTVQISASSTNQSVQANAPSGVQSADAIPAAPTDSSPDAQPSTLNSDTSLAWGRWLLAGLILLSTIALVTVLRRRNQRHSGLPNQATPRPTVIPNANPRAALKRLTRSLTRSSQDSHDGLTPLQVKQQLIEFAQQTHGCDPRQALAHLQSQTATANLLTELNALAYAPNATGLTLAPTNPQIQHLLAIAKEYSASRLNHKLGTTPLPTLYPQR